MKWNQKTACFFTALIMTVSLLAGCGRSEEPSVTTGAPATAPTGEPESVSRLFDELFVGLTNGDISLETEIFLQQAGERDFYVLEENAVLLIMDNERDGSFLRCELDHSNGAPVISRAVYSLDLGESQRQVLIKDLETRAEPELYIGMTQFREGEQVLSLNLVTEYLLAPLSQEETAPEDRATQLRLFEEVYILWAESPADIETIRREAENLGYFYREGEGQFTIQDEEHPDSYIYGLVDYGSEAPQTAAWGYHLSTDGGEYEVLVKFFTNPVQFFTQVTPAGEGKEVDSLEQLKEYIYRSRMLG